MAGAPIKRALETELSRRAEEAGDGATALSIVLEMVAGGLTLRQIAEDIGAAARQTISGATVRTWINRQDGGREGFAKAKADAAHQLVEEARELIDDSPEDRDAVAKAKAQADIRTWTASRYNRAAFGNDTAQVHINFGSLHLDALRARAITANAPPQLTAGDVVDAEIIPETASAPAS